MSQALPKITIPLKAYSTFASKQFYIVDKSTSGNYCDFTTAASDVAMGIMQDTPAADEYGQVAIAGTSKVALGGTVTEGDLLMSHTDGTAITKSGASYSVGKALQGGSAGDIIEMVICIVYYAA